jgi:CubicO group peptidase (beta-lactamase class C family)
VTGGFSATRLGRMHDVLAGYIERGELPGLVALMARRGEVHLDAIGCEPDTIFRIASMTKPIAAAAAMVLVEEGRLRLENPVDDLLPELAGMRVLRGVASPVDDTVPAAREITLRDLLTFRMGTGLVYAEAHAYPIQRAMEEAGRPENYRNADEWLRRLGSLPLVYQPGEVWMYSTSAEVLGVLIARAAKQTFGDFLAERIFHPLAMSDTGFWVPPRDLDRLAITDEGARGRWGRPPAFESGGGGLVSTVGDFLSFARMLMDGGGHILSRPAVEAMVTDQLTPEQKARTPWTPGFFETHGWGFGVGVDTAAHPGQYGWDGGFGTTWRSDPHQELIAILMTQVEMTSPEVPLVLREFPSQAYSALE